MTNDESDENKNGEIAGGPQKKISRQELNALKHNLQNGGEIHFLVSGQSNNY